MIEASNAVVAVVTFYAQELAKMAAAIEQLKSINASQAQRIAEQGVRIDELVSEVGRRG